MARLFFSLGSIILFPLFLMSFLSFFANTSRFHTKKRDCQWQCPQKETGTQMPSQTSIGQKGQAGGHIGAVAPSPMYSFFFSKKK